MMRRIMASKGRDRPVATPQEDGLIESIRRNPPPAGKATLVEVGNRTYLVTVAPLESALLLSGHRVVVAAPLDELLAAANETLVQGLAVSGAVVVVAVLLALVLAHLITKSLNQLTDSANRLQDLDFATPIDVSSHVAEISTLNGAMNRARDAIFTFALYVPKELVRKGIESGHFGGRAAWRQEVTAMFTDIYDFTTISEGRSPEEVVAMLSEYFDLFSEVVAAHDGTIIQFMETRSLPCGTRRSPIPGMPSMPVDAHSRSRRGSRPSILRNAPADCRSSAPASASTPERPSSAASAPRNGCNIRRWAHGERRLAARGHEQGLRHERSCKRPVVAQCKDMVKFRPLGTAKAKGRSTALDIYEVVGVVRAVNTTEAGTAA